MPEYFILSVFPNILLVYREDDAVFTELVKRVSENGKGYPYPQTEEDLLEMKQVFQRKVVSDDGGNS